MNENVLMFKSINELIGQSFFIPNYQRGYRWNEIQVKDLLEDIFEFSSQTRKPEEFYCLQPVIVKDKNGAWELIDGQQRLTTIYIILSYLQKRKYKIKYESRPNSEAFLEQISGNFDDSNIDFYFMSQAYITIANWFTAKEEIENDYTVKDEFNVTLGKFTKVIWYEVKDGTEARNIFTRINIGKIQLNNSELVKALFLNRENFKLLPKDITAKQAEIAGEWDQMELALQDDSFWYFLNKQINKMDSRIEFIFDLIAQKPPKHTDELFTFHAFNDMLNENREENIGKQKDELLKNVWEDIKHHYRLLREWYENWKFYHLIGFLLTVGEDIKELIKEAKNKTKPDFELELNKRIKGHVNVDLSGLSYDDNKNGDIQKVLLLFNVISILKIEDSSIRFSFNRYKGEGDEKRKWSLEHIHAQNSKGLNNVRQWNSWLKDHMESLKRIDAKKYENLVNEILDANTQEIKSEKFNILFNKVLDVLQEKNENKEEMHGISNLALLDSQSNSSLNNSIFEVKRDLIIKSEKKGAFIPFCTRNVFFKYYSKSAANLYYWSSDDQINYFDEIKTVLELYLPNTAY